MQNVGQNKNNKANNPLFSEITPAKASGLCFSLSSLLPTILLFLVLAVATAFGLKKGEYERADWYVYVSYLLPQISFALIAVFYLRLTKTPVKIAVAEQKCKPKYFLIAFLLQVGLLSLSELNGLFLNFLRKFGYQMPEMVLPNVDGFGFVGVFFVVAVLPAVFEEIMFRGVLLKGICSGFSVWASVLVCGVVFALYHQNPAQTIYQFCCGAAFALVAIRSGSILPTMLSHFCNNAFILILYKMEIGTIPTPVFLPLIIVSGVCLLGTLFYLIFMDKTKTQEENGKTEKMAEIKRFFLFASVGIFICVLSWISALALGM